MSANLLQQALAAHQRGDLAEAEKLYRAVLAAEPRNLDALALLGMACDGLGRREEALGLLRQAVAADPKAALFQLYLGNISMAAGLRADGIAAFRAAAALQPGRPEIFYNLGNALREDDQWDAARKAYEQALKLAPQHHEARNNLALCFEHEKDYDEAAKILERVVRDTPTYVEGWINLCAVTEKAKDYTRSLEAGLKARELAPQNPKAWFGIGVAYSRMKRESDALGYYLKTLELKPDWTEVWDNLGLTYQNLGRLDEAEKAFRQCIKCAGQEIADEDTRRVAESEYGNRHWHLALLQLLKGNYAQGFARYRARFKDVEGLYRPDCPAPVWQGEDLNGKTLLVMDEQGMGDCLMMLRYLPLLRAKGARIKLLVLPPLVPLLQGWDGVDEVSARGVILRDFHYCALIFDLPYGFGASVENVGANVPYLPQLPPDAETQIESDGRPRVGVVWAGTPLHKHDTKRSLPLELFSRLFENKNVQFFSFNRDKREGDDEILARYGVTDLAPRLKHFGHSARFMGQMDLIISCDTSTAHLAGGMGKRCWTMLPFAPDWRWLTGREDSPWYPSMRLFRQSTAGDWDGVMARLEAALKERF